MQHHSHHRPALPPAPMRAAARRLGQKTAVLKIGLRPGVAPRKAMPAHQMLMEVLGREAMIAFAVEPLDLRRRSVGNRAAGAPSKPPVDEPLLAVRLEPVAPAPQ
jgi:hypothetical protein